MGDDGSRPCVPLSDPAGLQMKTNTSCRRESNIWGVSARRSCSCCVPTRHVSVSEERDSHKKNTNIKPGTEWRRANKQSVTLSHLTEGAGPGRHHLRRAAVSC